MSLLLHNVSSKMLKAKIRNTYSTHATGSVCNANNWMVTSNENIYKDLYYTLSFTVNNNLNSWGVSELEENKFKNEDFTLTLAVNNNLRNSIWYNSCNKSKLYEYL